MSGITEWEYNEIAKETREAEGVNVRALDLLRQEIVILRRLVRVKEKLLSVQLEGEHMSVVRNNLLTRPGYTPYCGAENCHLHWPRTKFNGKQFGCVCGWRSNFEPAFIAQYEQFTRENPGQYSG